MEEIHFSKMAINFHHTTRHNIPENSSFHSHSCENLKSRKLEAVLFILEEELTSGQIPYTLHLLDIISKFHAVTVNASSLKFIFHPLVTAVKLKAK